MSWTTLPIVLNGAIFNTFASSRLSTPSSLIFGEQRIEHGAGLAAVFGEHVALLDVLGPLAARQRWAIEGHMADEIEGIEVLAKFLGDGIERQALGLQFLDDRLLALGTFPPL